VIGCIAASDAHKMRVSLDAYDGAGRADSFGQQAQNMSGATTEVDDTFTSFEANSVELRFSRRGEAFPLSPEP
jgi:hypothetical protein